MPATVMAASLKHIQKTFEIRIGISVRIFQRITHTGLGGEMNDDGETVLGEECFCRPRDRRGQTGTKVKLDLHFRRHRPAPA